jgi:uncharacterized protein (DUF4415 family)
MRPRRKRFSFPPPKILVTIALDQDVLEFLRRDSEPSNSNQVVNDTLRRSERPRQRLCRSPTH